MTGGFNRVVVVGASAAGLGVVEAMRREGFDGRLTLIGDEPHFPYDRPPLSKQVLSGSWHAGQVTLRDPDTFGKLDLDLRIGVSAMGVDLATRAVKLETGELVPFDGLVIATGVVPRLLPSGHDLDGVHVLRTLDDSLELRARLLESSNVVIVGAGFLGAEVAATSRGLGLDVTMIDPLAAPMLGQFGEQVGRLVAALHRDHGVRLLTGKGITRLIGEQVVAGVELSDGTVMDADTVFVAVGSIPATGWLSGSGIPLDDGVDCDETTQASPGIYAAGDVARWYNPRFGVRMRIEHRMNATEQGIAVARNLMGVPAPFDPIPYFWTDQFDARIQAHGVFPAGSEVTVVHGDTSERRFVAHYTHNSRLVGVLGWNMPRELRVERGLIEQQFAAVRSSRAAAWRTAQRG